MSLQTLRRSIGERWRGLSAQQQMVAAGTAALMGACAVALVVWAARPSYRPLASGLSPSDRLAVEQALAAAHIPYRGSADGTEIEVLAAKAHQARLLLAERGLPRAPTGGYELLDRVPLGYSAEKQRVDIRRAQEGELAETICQMQGVRSARVHLVCPEPALFEQEEKPTTGSVVVDLDPGRALSRKQVGAIVHLVSHSVEGLAPENVVVLDSTMNQLTPVAGRAGDFFGEGDSRAELTRRFESDLEQRVQTMLAPVMGESAAVVRVAADLNFDRTERESTRHEAGPQGKGVARSRQVTEETYGGGGGRVPGGIPGTTSNLAGGVPGYAVTAGGAGQYSRTEETVNYEVSSVSERVVEAPGDVKRLSVAVLVDGESPNVEQADKIRGAVAAAAGIDSGRGDTITIEAVPFAGKNEARRAQTAQQGAERWRRVVQWASGLLPLVAVLVTTLLLLRLLKAGERRGATTLEALHASESAAETTPYERRLVEDLTSEAGERPEALARLLRRWLVEE